MEKGIDFETALELHPAAVKRIETELRTSKSKLRNVPLEDFRWYYVWGVQVDSENWNDLSLTEEQYVELLNRKVMVWLYAVKRIRRCVKLDAIPPEIMDFYMKIRRDGLAEQARIAALTPEEHQKELEDSLRELSKDPHFFALHVPGR